MMFPKRRGEILHKVKAQAPDDDISTLQPDNEDKEIFVPLLSLVLFITAFMGFFGYNLQWLLVIDVLRLPYFFVFLLSLLGGCGICWSHVGTNFLEI
ncbi:hypothetical protein VNO78_23691 [Psophocarpus tetragonolobus]|uniref:Nodulin-like domain-containing protein n=1 Tax=Psophocarpus tetragonolobus TaxID=3891 RepID=A0AAN9S3J0_PSOTE